MKLFFDKKIIFVLKIEQNTVFLAQGALSLYAAKILSHKIFSFCEQTLKMGANDASGQGLQYALKNRRQNNFSVMTN